MRLDDGIAHGKADAHVLLHVEIVVRYAGKPTVENRRKLFLRNADAVVADGKAGAAALARELKTDLRDVAAVNGGVFQQVHHDLTNECCVHRHHQHLVRHLNGNLDIGETLGEFADRNGNDFFRCLAFLFDLGLAAAHARDGKKVLHHTDKPLGVLVHIFKKAALLLGGEGILVVKDRRRIADDAGERRADIVRHGAQEIGAHGFLFRFEAQLFLLFDLRVHRADHDGNGQHGKEGERVAGDRKVKRPIGVGKDEVDEENGRYRTERAPEKALCPTRDARDRQHKNEVDVAAAVVESAQQCAEDRRDCQNCHGEQKIVKMAQVLGLCFHIAALSRLIIGAEKASAYYLHLLYHTSR